MNTWKEVWKRLQSPVVLVVMLIMILNLLRTQFGWVIPIEEIEDILNWIVYVGGGGFAALNNPTDKKSF